jgi:iron complex outermembrane recepter protein
MACRPIPVVAAVSWLAQAPVAVGVIAAALLLAPAPARAQAALEVTQMSLEDLMNIQLTTLSRKPQRLTDTAAAAYVLTADDIQRSGATNLPDALRLVPGLEVERIGSGRWAVSARGFNGRFANKLQVLIDGRSVYAPLFSGVFWEAEDVLLEDIDRIEVIRGSGAALWGANAVNGVINIVTRSARSTQGTLVTALAGDEDRYQTSLRQGAQLDNDSAIRFWAKAGERRDLLDADGRPAAHPWVYRRAGFRLDRDLVGGAVLMVNGSLHQGSSGEDLLVPQLTAPYIRVVPAEQSNRGVSLVGRYQWRQPGGGLASLQAAVDSNEVGLGGTLRDRWHTFDLDFQHQQALGELQDVIWGLGYRHTTDRFDPRGDLITFTPAGRTSEVFSAFVQDEWRVVPQSLQLIGGAKIEHNNFTGFAFQPNLRALWTPAPRQTVWAAISRAVRTPSRAERDAATRLFVEPPMTVNNPSPLPVLTESQSNDQLMAESVLASELGYRWQLDTGLSVDLAAFRSRYRDLRSAASLGADLAFENGVPYVQNRIITANTLGAISRGLDLSVDWHALPGWRWQASYSHLKLHATRNGDAAADNDAATLEGNAPRFQASLRASIDLPRNQQLDLRLKRVGERGAVGIPAYTELDLRYAWRVTTQFEVSLVGQNLLGRHLEAGSDPLPSQRREVPRAAYVKLRWQF